MEFGNRLVALVGILLTLATWLAARRVERLPRGVRLTALGAFLGSAAQIPLGGAHVIFDLHPLLVMSHFLLALVVVGLAAVVAVEAWAIYAVSAPGRPTLVESLRDSRCPVCLLLVVTGAVATASGPHSGGEDIRRLGLAVTDAVWVHVRATAVFGIGLVLVGAWIVMHRRAVPGIARVGLALLLVLGTQMLVGEVQYRNALPWGLVLVHVLLAATVWMLTRDARLHAVEASAVADRGGAGRPPVEPWSAAVGDERTVAALSGRQ